MVRASSRWELALAIAAPDPLSSTKTSKSLTLAPSKSVNIFIPSPPLARGFSTKPYYILDTWPATLSKPRSKYSEGSALAMCGGHLILHTCMYIPTYVLHSTCTVVVKTCMQVLLLRHARVYGGKQSPNNYIIKVLKHRYRDLGRRRWYSHTAYYILLQNAIWKIRKRKGTKTKSLFYFI